MAMDTAARRDRLRARLAAAGLDALLVTDLVNVSYLTGFTGSAGRLLVATDTSSDRFVTDGRYEQQAVEEVSGVRHVISRDDDWLAPALQGRTSLGLESRSVSWEDARTLIDLLPGVDSGRLRVTWSRSEQ